MRVEFFLVPNDNLATDLLELRFFDFFTIVAIEISFTQSESSSFAW